MEASEDADGKITFTYDFPSYQVAQTNGDILVKKARKGTITSPGAELMETWDCGAMKRKPTYTLQANDGTPYSKVGLTLEPSWGKDVFKSFKINEEKGCYQTVTVP